MKILIACQIHPSAIETLRSTHSVTVEPYPPQEKLKELISTANVLVMRSGVAVSAEVLEAASELGLVIRAGSGTDNIDLQALEKRGIALERVPGLSARSVAELGLALFLALGRRILEADRSVRNRTWEKEKLIGWELKGKTLGVVGAGTTGRCMGRLGVSMGMHVVACVKRYTPQRVAQMQQEGIRLVHFDEVIQTADLVSVHVPLDDSTRNLFDISTLSRMKSGAFLVNLSRGGVVDESALAQNLQQRGGLGGAALDVHEREGPGVSSPLTGFPNVILTPHIGAQTEGAHRKLGKHIVDTVDAFRPGAPLGGRLDGLDQRTTDLSGDREPADE